MCLKTKLCFTWRGLMLKSKLQYFVHLIWRATHWKKALMPAKTESKWRGWQRMRWLNGVTDSMDMSLSKLREMGKDRKAWHTAVHVVTKNHTLLSYWITGAWVISAWEVNSWPWHPQVFYVNRDKGLGFLHILSKMAFTFPRLGWTLNRFPPDQRPLTSLF